jgi:hypothetical protein
VKTPRARRRHDHRPDLRRARRRVALVLRVVEVARRLARAVEGQNRTAIQRSQAALVELVGRLDRAEDQ